MMVTIMFPYSLLLDNTENLASRERKRDKCDFNMIYSVSEVCFLL